MRVVVYVIAVAVTVATFPAVGVLYLAAWLAYKLEHKKDRSNDGNNRNVLVR